MSPSIVIDRVDVAASLETHPTARSTSWHPVHCRHVDKFAGVELESWLSAQGFEMDIRVGIVKLDQPLHWLLSGVGRNARRISIHDEAVVRRWLFGAERKFLVRGNTWEGLNCTSGNSTVTHNLMHVGRYVGFGACNCWTVANVEVTTPLVSSL